MHRRIVIGERSFDLNLLAAAETGEVQFRLEPYGAGSPASADGFQRDRVASVIEVAPQIWSVLIDGRSYEARVLDSDAVVVVEINGERYPVTVEDPRKRKPKRGASVGEGRVSITAPMPGKIVRVLAAAGDTVAAGQGIIVIEAMKMQNEMKAPCAGRIASLEVSEGETVAAGAVLAVVE